MTQHRRAPRILISRMAFLACVLTCAGIAIGQGLSRPAKSSKGKVTTTKALPPPILKRDPQNKRDWTLTAVVRLHGYQARAINDQNLTPTSRIQVDRAAFLFPLIPDSGMHQCYLDKTKGSLRLANRIVNDSPRIVDGYQGGARLGVIDATNIDTVRVTMQYEILMTCYETIIDETRARAIPWPQEPWEPLIASTLEPQLFVEVNDPGVQALVKQWTNGNPRGYQPYDLAKMLAGKVVEYFQPSEGIYETSGRGLVRGDVSAVLINGYNVHGARLAAANRRGSPHDMACLLTAVYRAAGLPSRLVIGFDVNASQNRPAAQAEIRAWTEFYLLDEVNKRGEWIPVDILKQRAFSSRPPPLTQSWEYFGNSQQWDFMCPIAYHWHPPTAAINQGPPALWGWIPQPLSQGADQEIRFFAFETPRRGDDPEVKNRNTAP